MREAERLLDGVRQGQPLGALLGYQFERRLQELKLQQFIDDFRLMAPLDAGRLPAGARPEETIAANNVVDGLLLNQNWRTEISNVPGLTGSALERVKHELVALGECIDGLSDALTAETAYQIVRGNPARTASTLQAVSRGEAPPPELEVARTPRSGVGLTHRVLVLFKTPAAEATGWASAMSSPRAIAEPALNVWAGKLLPAILEKRGSSLSVSMRQQDRWSTRKR